MGLVKQITIGYVRTQLALLSKISKRKAAQKALELFTTPPTRVSKELPPVFQKAEVIHFVFQGVKIVGYRWNHPQQKKVLILHGFESSVVNFDKYVGPLLKKGYEVLAFDAPAHGKSGGKIINAVDYKNFILHILATYGPITSFVSHSYGGLALSLALEETPHDESWKVVFIAPATESVTATKQFFSLVRLDGEVKSEFEKLIEEANGKPLSWYSVARAAAHIRAQVLFLQDKQDLQTPYSDVEPIIKKGYPNFRFVISDGLGHRRIYKDASTIETIMAFL
ncbi:alpha/beta hydrolase [Flavisolibacter nicotianae]|uniref:alpha/beta hydrolase n=1 Tax=Flavisolibacter nicotianae TaxID=2364882 RepID=UPI0013C4D085|nr:alpha/beta fold hydrolase [Flavisolibacter nicotianae]